jgi:NAD(P)H-dependent flavin oxidoreductase YrpB (nitropropane dioxygenase family)
VSAAVILRTQLTELLGIDYPIIQTGMGWVASARLTAATSAAGGLGILGSATMNLDELRTALDEVRGATDRPFGVNFRSDNPDVESVVDLLVDRGVHVASFGRAPRADLIRRLKDAGITCIPTVGALRHAEKVVELGVDAVIIQGAEGGGHTGVVPTSLLLPQVVDKVSIPVIAAGGYFDGRGLISALAYGAAGIAMGTRFLLTEESPVHRSIKDVYLERSVTDTVVTRAIDGAPQRVVRTPMIDRLERSLAPGRMIRAGLNALRFQRLTGNPITTLVREGWAMKRSQDLTWAQMLMAPNAPMLTRAALLEGRVESGVLPVGQVVGMIHDLPSVEVLLERIMSEAAETLLRLEESTGQAASVRDRAGGNKIRPRPAGRA